MDYININKLLDDLDKLASELRENKLKCHYNSQENHVATVRNAQSALITLQSELRNK